MNAQQKRQPQCDAAACAQRETLSSESQIVESLSPQLLTRLSFSHLTEISDIEMVMDQPDPVRQCLEQRGHQ